MKALLFLCLTDFLVLLTQANPLDELSTDDDMPGKVHTLYQKHYSKYKKYLKKFGKKHDLSVPEPIRLLKFAQNMKFVEEHNERYRKGLETYKLAINEMSDWTEKEKERLYGYFPNNTRKEAGNMTKILGNKLRKTIPRSLDYRKITNVLPVKRQGACRVCFIFSALGALEIYAALKSKKPPVSLSVQDVMDCSNMEKCGGKGGNEAAVFDWVAENGVATDKHYPYKESDSVSCPIRKSERAKGALAGSAFLPHGDEDVIRRVLALYGPVCLSLHASLADFQFYSGNDIYYNPSCPKDNDHVNHAVLAVGYGVENGVKYFIIRNSWGPSWGDKGYGRIRAGVKACGIGLDSAIPIFF
ncbi:unnamed protein product [Litomosoides sigmodontis]|uniref:Peptidase C1A papain C-terminal domain-containing protein n=1 Tax=Litomosoides sigmodontis TaxID=42156 RepID=A0A3P6TSN2_LITSI|nr:unnamed protein product [Litomosoides sigmodontis]